jgi:hypothetical protein
VLEENVWKDITPPGIPKGDPKNLIAQGIALDPCHPGTIYWGNTPFDAPFGGLYKSVDGGSTWRKIGTLDEPLHIRVDPRDPQHLYAGDGVRGGTLGFWVSHDGGETWAKPAAWTDLAQRESVFIDDVYDVAVDPADFDHVLVSAHSPWAWDSVEYARSSGVVESKDGGQSWTLHRPELSWGSGHSIDFLHEPSQGIGDANTWLLGTQSDGIWRTTNGGASWAQVVPTSIFHGGNHIYYSKTGVLYAGSGGPLLRSSDNGAHWTELSPNLGYTAVFGDGNLLFTAPAYGRNAQPFLSSPEEDGVTWTPFAAGAQTFTDGGPFEMAFEPNASILYSSNWFQGLWALARPKK